MAFDDCGDVIGRTRQRVGFLRNIERLIVDTWPTALMPDVAKDAFDDMWRNAKTLMHCRREVAPEIVQHPRWHRHDLIRIGVGEVRRGPTCFEYPLIKRDLAIGPTVKPVPSTAEYKFTIGRPRAQDLGRWQVQCDHMWTAVLGARRR